MLTEESLLAHLKQIVGDDSKDPWSEDNIPYLFQRFRPDGDGLEAALSVLPNASSYVARLLSVYKATKHDNWAREMYFVVRQPEPAKEPDIVALGQRFLANLRVLAGVIGDHEFSSYLASVTSVQLVTAVLLDRNCDDNLLLYDTVGDFLPHHMPYEAYYSI